MLRPAYVLLLAIVANVGGDQALAANWPSVSNTIGGDVARFAPPLVTRDQWKAKAALSGMKAHKPTGIIIHHMAAPMNPRATLETKLRNLQSFSQKPAPLTPKKTREAWGDIPYHYYVDMNGRIGEARDVRFAGDSNTRYDTRGFIQVVLEGNFEKETPQPAQLESLRKLLVSLMLAWNVPVERISTHKDNAATTCPGRNFTAVLPQQLKLTAEERRRTAASHCSQGPSAEFARLYCAAR